MLKQIEKTCRDDVVKLVSVVMPVYNDKKYIKAAVDSIMSQTYQNFELIIVDSSDDLSTWDGIDLKREKIRYYWVEKTGIADALNFGIRQAKGEFIARMDADDISYSNRLKRQVDYLLQNENIMLVGTAIDIIDAEGNITGEGKVITDIDTIKARLAFECCFNHPTVMMRRTIFDRGDYYDGRYISEDYDLWTRLVQKYQVANINEKLLKYRVHGDNESIVLRRKVAMSVARIARNYIEEMYGIEMSDYQIDDTRLYIRLFENTQYIPAYICRQVKLLRDIYENNKHYGRVDDAKLIDQLNERWMKVLGYYGRRKDNLIYSNIERDFRVIEKDKTVLFLDVLSQRYNCNGNAWADLQEKLYDELEKSERDITRFLMESRSFVLYGIGRNGWRFIEDYWLNDKRIRSTNWRLVAVSDRKTQTVSINGKKYESIEPELLPEMDVDYIVVTPAKYDEVSNSLMNLGVPREKILYADVFV